jgi:hypothetical protein
MGGTMNKLKATTENLTSRIAAARSGRVKPADLLPWLPISLEMAEEHLRDMVDGSVVIETRAGGFLTFEFPEFLGREPCEIDLSGGLFTSRSDKASVPQWHGSNPELQRELMGLAETNAWPSLAVREHEIISITAGKEGPIRVASVAGRSRLTLSRLQEDLKRLTSAGYIKAVLNEDQGILTYEFPLTHYNRDWYQRNDAFIRRHPSSHKDEVEIKMIRSLKAVMVIMILCFIAAIIFHLPFLILIVMSLTISAIRVIQIFNHKVQGTPEKL